MQTTGTVCTLCARSTYSRWNHRVAAVRVAFGARLHARLAADAAARVDEEVQVSVWPSLSYLLRLEPRGVRRRAAGLATRQPHTLYCGNLADRILAATVSRFALFSPASGTG
jgi:hypothetical protein